MATTLFTGASRYSQDFGAVIDRQVGIASLRLTQMQQGRTKSNDEISALRAVNIRISVLQSTLQGIEDSVVKNSWQATSSDSSAVKAGFSDGAAAGSYNLRVISVGSLANSVSTNKVADPGSGAFVTNGTTSLTVKVKNLDTNTEEPEKAISISGTTLQDVVDGINATAGLNVQAAVVNLGSAGYGLSLQSAKYGKFEVQLEDNAGDLMSIPADSSDSSLGSLVEYKINGATVTTDSRSITVAPKVTAELLKADATKDITISVSQGTSAFQSAMNNFVSAYNSAVDEMEKYTGQNGALVGNALVASLRQQLSNAVTAATGGGTLDSMAKIGLEFTQTGRLSFNSSLFINETKNQLTDLQTLIGTAKTSGFMKTATDALKTINDGNNGGILAGTLTSLDTSLKAEDARIEAETRRVEQFTKDLQERLAKADALIAQMEQQANYFNNMFEAMRTNQKSMS